MKANGTEIMGDGDGEDRRAEPRAARVEFVAHVLVVSGEVVLCDGWNEDVLPKAELMELLAAGRDGLPESGWLHVYVVQQGDGRTEINVYDCACPLSGEWSVPN
jgi:hypothetical protein